jgi:ribose transport system permease protein/inositol transport system permease protein
MSTVAKVASRRRPVILSPRTSLLFLTLVFVVAVALIKPRFVSIANLLNILQQMVPIGFIALGEMYIIVSGGIDLSIGNGTALSAVVLGLVFSFTKNPWLSIFASIAVGASIGTFNALFISKAKLPPFVVTLATLSVASGLQGMIASGRTVFLKSELFDLVGSGRLYGIPNSFIILFVVYLFGFVLYNFTSFGPHTVALGTSELNARLIGLNVDSIRMSTYILSGIFIGITGIILASRLMIVQPGIGGDSLLFDALTAVILGGTSLTGGRGTVQGVLGGVLFMSILGNALNILNIPPIFYNIFKGVVIVAALFINWSFQRTSESRR